MILSSSSSTHFPPPNEPQSQQEKDSFRFPFPPFFAISTSFDSCCFILFLQKFTFSHKRIITWLLYGSIVLALHTTEQKHMWRGNIWVRLLVNCTVSCVLDPSHSIIWLAKWWASPGQSLSWTSEKLESEWSDFCLLPFPNRSHNISWSHTQHNHIIQCLLPKRYFYSENQYDCGRHSWM